MSVSFANGARCRADVVIGADGNASAVRSLLFPGEAPRFNGQVAFRALIPDELVPAVFRQRRYGLYGESINVYKFRTMRVLEDGQKVTQAQRNDPRVTRFGSFLRRTSLDERCRDDLTHAIAGAHRYRRFVDDQLGRFHERPDRSCNVEHVTQIRRAVLGLWCANRNEQDFTVRDTAPRIGRERKPTGGDVRRQ